MGGDGNPRKPKATATTWVAKDKDGNLTPVRVAEMEDDHLFRWIRYFRKKYRDQFVPNTPDAVVDARIKLDIVTAPAIYAEAVKRGIPLGGAVAPVTPTTTTSEPPTLGRRRITLDED